MLQILQAHAWVLRAPWDPSNLSTIEAVGFLESLQALRGGSFRAHAWLQDCSKSVRAHAWVLRAPWDPSNPSTIEAEGFLESLQALRGGSFRAHAWLKDCCKSFKPMRGSFELLGTLQTPRRLKLKDFWKSFLAGWVLQGPPPG